MLIGESYIGEGAEAAHVNTVLGERAGPVGVAWATALATPSAGHTPFVAVVIPGIPVKPMTLFVNKAPIAGDEHGTLTWGAAQAGGAPHPAGAGGGRHGDRRPAGPGARSCGALSTRPCSAWRPTRASPGSAPATRCTVSPRSRACLSAATPSRSRATCGGSRRSTST